VVALLVALILTFAMAAGVFAYGIKRPVGKPLTWGEALLGGTYIYALIFLMYGVVPHQWLTFADTTLKMRKDAVLAGPGSKGAVQWLPFTITKQTVRDIVVTMIYIVFLGAMIAGWSLWQNRGKAKPVAIETSTYGRPLVKAR
jgi:hypothetical protein